MGHRLRLLVLSVLSSVNKLASTGILIYLARCTSCIGRCSPIGTRSSPLCKCSGAVSAPFCFFLSLVVCLILPLIHCSFDSFSVCFSLRFSVCLLVRLLVCFIRLLLICSRRVALRAQFLCLNCACRQVPPE